MAWIAAALLALAPQEAPSDEELEALLAATEELGAEAMLDFLSHAAWVEALQAALRDADRSAGERAVIHRALHALGAEREIADAPKATVVPEPPPPEATLRRKKTARAAPVEDTMAPALLFGGAVITLAGLLLWTLRRKD